MLTKVTSFLSSKAVGLDSTTIVVDEIVVSPDTGSRANEKDKGEKRMSLSHDHAAKINANIIDSLRAENARLQKRMVVLEKALEETFQDCYSINEFGKLCTDCERHKFILTRERKRSNG